MMSRPELAAVVHAGLQVVGGGADPAAALAAPPPALKRLRAGTLYDVPVPRVAR